MKSTINRLSLYRTELMGIAMLSVLIVHLLGWLALTPEVVSRAPALLGYTDAFLILSGLGIYYSLSDEFSVGKYLTKRIKRLVIPYMLLSLPFYLAIWSCCHRDVLFVINEITTISFWVNGNTYGMWYVAISIVLYLLAPLLYFSIRNMNEWSHVLTIVILCIWLTVEYAIDYYFHDYYNMTSIALEKSGLFYVGMILGGIITHNDERERNLCIIFFVLLNICTIYMGGVIKTFTGGLYRGVIIPIFLSFLIPIIKKHIRGLYSLLKWIGSYTLEIYIIYLLEYALIKELAPQFKHNPVVIISIIVTSVLIAPIAHLFISKIVNRLIEI